MVHYIITLSDHHDSTREPDPGISEGVCSIIHAAPRTELKGMSKPIY